MASGIVSRSGMAKTIPDLNLVDGGEAGVVPSQDSAELVVLVVDDEDIVRAVAAQMLRILGFKVLAAAGAREALSILRLEKNIDAILLDNHMPEMTGSEAFSKIRQIRPDVPVLLISGLSLDGIDETIYDDPRAHILHKPYRFIQLQKALGQALSA